MSKLELGKCDCINQMITLILIILSNFYCTRNDSFKKLFLRIQEIINLHLYCSWLSIPTGLFSCSGTPLPSPKSWFVSIFSWSRLKLRSKSKLWSLQSRKKCQYQKVGLYSWKIIDIDCSWLLRLIRLSNLRDTWIEFNLRDSYWNRLIVIYRSEFNELTIT